MRQRDLTLSFLAVAAAAFVILAAQATPLPAPAKTYSLVEMTVLAGRAAHI